MKKIGLKLSVAVIAFLIGVIGSAFCFFYTVSSNKSDKPVFGGGSAAPNETKRDDQRIKIVVTGRVVDSAGRPIRGAKVQASLGLDLEGALVETEAAGRFQVEAHSGFWFKEECHPNVRAYAAGYAEEWVHFDCSDWNEGERWFEQTIVLKPKVRQ